MKSVVGSWWMMTNHVDKGSNTEPPIRLWWCCFMLLSKTTLTVVRSGSGRERERERSRRAGQVGTVEATHAVQVSSSHGSCPAWGCTEVCLWVGVWSLCINCPQVCIGNTSVTGGSVTTRQNRRSVQYANKAHVRPHSVVALSVILWFLFTFVCCILGLFSFSV